MEVTWVPAELPKQYEFVIGDAQGWEDMFATNSLAVPTSRTIQIVAEAAGGSRPAPESAAPLGGSSGSPAEPEEAGTPLAVNLLRVVALLAFVGVLAYAAHRRRKGRTASSSEETAA